MHSGLHFNIINDMDILLASTNDTNYYPMLLFIKDHITVNHLVTLFNRCNINISYGHSQNSFIMEPDILSFYHDATKIMYMFENIYDPQYSAITSNYLVKYIYVSSNGCPYIRYIQRILICLAIYCGKNIDGNLESIYGPSKPIIMVFCRYLVKLCYLNKLISGADYYLLTNNNKYLPQYLSNSRQVNRSLYMLSPYNYKTVYDSNMTVISFSIIDCINHIYLPIINNGVCYVDINNLVNVIEYALSINK